MFKKYIVYGPVQDGMFSKWQVIGPRGGIKGETYTKVAALRWAKELENASK